MIETQRQRDIKKEIHKEKKMTGLLTKKDRKTKKETQKDREK